MYYTVFVNFVSLLSHSLKLISKFKSLYFAPIAWRFTNILTFYNLGVNWYDIYENIDSIVDGNVFLFLDSNTSYLEEQEVSRPPSSDEMDFDTLLQLSQKNLKDRKESCRGR